MTKRHTELHGQLQRLVDARRSMRSLLDTVGHHPPQEKKLWLRIHAECQGIKTLNEQLIQEIQASDQW